MIGSPESDDPRYARNPVVVIEVLSESIRRIDQTEKRQGYFHLPSLKVLLLVDSESCHVVVHRRQPDEGFRSEDYQDRSQVIELPEIEASLALADLYEDTAV
ncbi:hypothetical protein Hsar01_03887 [Haloferula sargassicola]|uniref:Putative restriction endonuclease domain-containing protein n=1 Tax=Haloferula sargassicola TaxID=490096 RepID=A0ABP9UVA3_9BACT